MVELRHELNINLGLILTHQLDLSLKILSASLIELQEQIDEIVLQNPLIDIDANYRTAPNNYFESKFKEIDQNYKVKFESEEEYDELDFIEQETTFEQKLLQDLVLSHNLNQKEIQIAEQIIYNLDEKGYFLDYGLDKKYEYIRRLIMNLEPLGVGTKNVQEFFHLQNEFFYKNEPYFNKLNEFLDTIFTFGLDLKKLQKFNLNDKQVQFFLEKIKAFRPYPLYGYIKSRQEDFLYYDIEIKQIGNEFIPIVNDEFSNKLIVNETLINQIKDVDFLKEKLKEIKILHDAINMRYQTLLKIANIVVQKQRLFFEKGVLTPLSMSQIAMHIGYSVSTISRALSNKYILFKSKIYPFKVFFSSASKEGISKHRILEIIKAAIAQEDASNPLDDESLRQILIKHNINVTRRAVVKYRQELKIPKAKDRKSEFLL
ncbi:hypothetical protein [Desulfurella multipotens]|uniref:RNA polymerase factor sigma-54 n=1 Tax=Desulfurella multipotens TaxID=79269 RepID=UPI000CBEC97F|nr:hypothetical protein [Desulfurella multipotens]PMP69033.1 MAG: hypothetical protein C0192_00865 [Desulfurella multipotens]